MKRSRRAQTPAPIEPPPPAKWMTIREKIAAKAHEYGVQFAIVLLYLVMGGVVYALFGGLQHDRDAVVKVEVERVARCETVQQQQDALRELYESLQYTDSHTRELEPRTARFISKRVELETRFLSRLAAIGQHGCKSPL